MNSSGYSTLTTRKDQTDLSLFDADYLSTHPSFDQLSQQFTLHSDADIEMIDQQLWELMDKYEAEHGHPLPKGVKSVIRGQMEDSIRPSRETMNTYPSSPQEVTSAVADQAMIDAVNAAEPGGYVDVDAVGRGIASATLFDQPRIEGGGESRPVHTKTIYQPEVVEAEVQAAIAAQTGVNSDFADVIGEAVNSKASDTQYPMSPEVRVYADTHNGGQTTGAPDRFGAVAKNSTIAALERVTAEAGLEGNWLQRLSSAICDARSKSVGAEPGTITLPPEYQS